MRQVLQHDQEVYLEVERETEFWGWIENAFRSQEIPAWCPSFVILRSFVQKISKSHHQYQKITEAYGDPNYLQGDLKRTYLDPVELPEYAQGVHDYPKSQYYDYVHDYGVLPNLDPCKV